jgi:hypothetical protein
MDKALSFFKNYGQIIAYIATLLIFIGGTYQKFQNLERRVTEQETKSEIVTRIDANLQMTMQQLGIKPIMVSRSKE